MRNYSGKATESGPVGLTNRAALRGDVMQPIDYYFRIRAEITGSHPVTGPYSSDDEIAAAELNAENITEVISETRVTELDILRAFDDPRDGHAALDKMEAAALMDALVARMDQIKLGSGLAPNTQMGPLISAEHREKVEAYVALANEEGACPVIGGRRPDNDTLRNGFFYLPTLFTHCHSDMRVVQEESFGPVITVERFHTEEEAIREANKTIYGLSAGVWTQSRDRIRRVTAALRFGTVWVNDFNVYFAKAPWGGFKQSGIGRELGRAGLEEYRELKHVYENHQPTAVAWFGDAETTQDAPRPDESATAKTGLPGKSAEIQAILFDMDGTLVDTEEESGEALVRVFQARHGVTLGAEALDVVVGAAWDDAIQELCGRFRIDETDPAGLKAALHKSKSSWTRSLLQDSVLGQRSMGAASSRRGAAVTIVARMV